MKNKLTKLLDLKSIVTLIMTIGLLYGFVSQKISSEQFVTFVTMIFTFYFSKKDGSDKDGE